MPLLRMARPTRAPGAFNQFNVSLGLIVQPTLPAKVMFARFALLASMGRVVVRPPLPRDAHHAPLPAQQRRGSWLPRRAQPRLLAFTSRTLVQLKSPALVHLREPLRAPLVSQGIMLPRELPPCPPAQVLPASLSKAVLQAAPLVSRFLAMRACPSARL